jgi:hypothetical protein
MRLNNWGLPDHQVALLYSPSWRCVSRQQSEPDTAGSYTWADQGSSADPWRYQWTPTRWHSSQRTPRCQAETHTWGGWGDRKWHRNNNIPFFTLQCQPEPHYVGFVLFSLQHGFWSDVGHVTRPGPLRVGTTVWKGDMTDLLPPKW